MEVRAVAAGAAALALLVALVMGGSSLGVAQAAGPAVVFTSTPAADTNQITATFVFQPATGVTCSLDGVALGSCASPQVLTGLSEGQHTFTVQLVATGAAVPTPYTWTVDLTPPTTQITGRPPTLTNSKAATFTFTSPDPTASFRCSLNGATMQPCASPLTYTGLSDGTRSLLIQAVDPAGNADSQAQPITWTVDTTPPDTTLANPGNLVGADVAVFTFTSTEAGSTFQCSFRNAPFTACTSPTAVDVPHSGSQTFMVRAVDGAGNVDPTPAVHQWTSDLTPPKRPTVHIFAAPSASATVVPRPTPERRPPLNVTFTNPLAKLLTTPTFTLSTRLLAQWSSDATAKTFDVTVDSFPQDSTTMGFHGEDLDSHQEYRNTKRTAVRLNLYPGTTVCVKVDAKDKVGNTSRSRLTCTTIPVSFTPRDVGPPPVKDAKAFRGYYIRLGVKGYEFVQDIGDEFFFTPTHAALVAERCPKCGVVEFDWTRFVGNPHDKLHVLATVNLDSSAHSGDFELISVNLPVHRLERDGMGDLVIRAAAGHPPIAGIGLSS